MHTPRKFVLFAISLFAGCATVHDAGETGECKFAATPENAFVQLSADELSIRLPQGSSLARSNTEDAEYWIWDTPLGEVSVGWISGIARESRIASMSDYRCRLEGPGIDFTFDAEGRYATAVSNALLPNGAGLFVRFDMLAGENSAASS
jgi:hypothetical protein